MEKAFTVSYAAGKTQVKYTAGEHIVHSVMPAVIIFKNHNGTVTWYSIRKQ